MKPDKLAEDYKNPMGKRLHSKILISDFFFIIIIIIPVFSINDLVMFF